MVQRVFLISYCFVKKAISTKTPGKLRTNWQFWFRMAESHPFWNYLPGILYTYLPFSTYLDTYISILQNVRISFVSNMIFLNFQYFRNRDKCLMPLFSVFVSSFPLFNLKTAWVSAFTPNHYLIKGILPHFHVIFDAPIVFLANYICRNVQHWCGKEHAKFYRDISIHFFELSQHK